MKQPVADLSVLSVFSCKSFPCFGSSVFGSLRCVVASSRGVGFKGSHIPEPFAGLVELDDDIEPS